MRLVLDTSILVAALRSDKGASRRLLLDALDKRFILLASVPLMIEYEAVMTRREHLDAARVSADEVIMLLDAVASVAEPVRLDFSWRPVMDDPDDDLVLEAAANGRADGIVTFNMKDFRKATLFAIEAMRPIEALERLSRQ